MRNLNGEVIGLVGITHDITKIKAQEEALQRNQADLQSIIESSGLAFVLLDLKGIIRIFNGAAQEYQQQHYGITLEAGSSMLDYIPAVAHPIFLDRLAKVKAGETLNFVNQITTQDKLTYFDFHYYPVKSAVGNIVGVNVAFEDITVRKEIERQLYFNASLQKTVSSAVIVTDMNLQIQSWNEAAERIYGWSAEEVIGKRSLELFKTEFGTGDSVSDSQRELFTNGTWQREIVQSRKDGSKVQIYASLNLFKDESGNPLVVIGVTNDISERKRAEGQLSFLASLQENMLDAVIATDMNFQIQSWNKAAESIYGWLAAEVIGKPAKEVLASQFINGVSREDVTKTVLEVGYWDGEALHKCRDGSLVNILSSVALLKDKKGNPTGTVAVNRDISERKEAELQLSFLASLQEHMLAAVIATDIQFKVISWSKEAEQIYGWSAEEAIGKSIPELFQSRLLTGETIEESIQTLMEKGSWSGEAIQTRHDGRLVYILSSVALLKDKAGDTVGVVSVHRDITERKQAEEARLALAQRLELATFAAGIGIWDWDLKDNQLTWDPQMFELYIILPENFSGTNNTWEHFVHPQDYARVQAEINDAISGKTDLNSEFRVIWPTGNIHHLKLTGLVLYDEDGAPERMLGVNMDITNQKLYEATLEQALQQEKELNELKSRFVSVASHEFLTPLATILATAENLMAYRERMDNSQIDKRLNKIMGQIDHLKLIMEDVLLLSRMQAGRLEFNPVETDLNAFCQDIIEEFESNPKIQHQIFYSCTSQPMIAQIDHKLMRHILNNLLSNALKYSPAGKNVYIEVSVHEEQFKIMVRDEGIGIPEQDFKHLFEAFHRAGNVGTISGTGLGLTITKQSVETHGGTIEVESKVGEGTTFIVTIP